MLKPEEAQEQLKQFIVPDLRNIQISRCSELPPILRELALWLIGKKPQSYRREKPDKTFFAALDTHAAQAAASNSGLTDKQFSTALRDAASAEEQPEFAVAVLETVSPALRMKFFEGMYPKLALALESAWQLTYLCGYQMGWSRKTFRSPLNPGLTRTRRCNWFGSLCNTLNCFDPDAEWCAVWAGHLSRYGRADEMGILLAGAINLNNEASTKIFDVLATSVKSEHEIAVFGRHVSRALMLSSREDAWELMEKMLLAAQRQEGLRQAILEAIDECHPQAFRRMLRLILDQNLIRFSATVRAVAVWFGLHLESATPAIVERIVLRANEYLNDKKALEFGLKKGTGEDSYLALWALAFDEIAEALPAVEPLLGDASPERRFAAVCLLGNLGVASAQPLLVQAMQDSDMRIAVAAFSAVSVTQEHLPEFEKFIQRIDEKEMRLEPLVWPWTGGTISRQNIADRMPRALGNLPPARLIPYLPEMSVYSRANALKTLAEENPWPEGRRQLIVEALGDASSHVRSVVLQTLSKVEMSESDAPSLEKLLQRKSGDLRQGILTLLMKLKDDEALASSKRLMSSRDGLQRVAGLELLSLLGTNNRNADGCRAEAEAYKSQREDLNPDEKQLIQRILKDDTAPALTLDNALGLLDPLQRTPPLKPVVRNVKFFTPATLNIITALDELIHENREKEIPGYGNEVTQLGAMRWFHIPYNIRNKTIPEQLESLPLRSLWERFLRERDATRRDSDGLELIRVEAKLERWTVGQRVIATENFWHFAEIHLTPEVSPPLKYLNLIRGLVHWLRLLEKPDPKRAAQFMLDCAETLAALIPPDKILTFPPKPKGNSFYYGYNPTQNLLWRDHSPLKSWLDRAIEQLNAEPAGWSEDQIARLYRICRWCDEPITDATSEQPVPRDRAPDTVLLAAFKAGSANKADILDELLGPRGGRYSNGFNLLSEATGRSPSKRLADHPVVIELAERCREKILESELARGDLPTVASAAAFRIRSVWGIDDLVRLLVALGARKLVRNSNSYWRSSENKEEVLSHLIRVSFPREDDKPVAFCRAIEKAKIPESRLIELALFAPQWSKFVEYTLSWDALEDAAWWIRAHTKDNQWRVDEDVRAEWNAEVQERTPLTGADLLEGGVDVDWFRRCYKPLGEKRWEKLSNAAKFASSGIGHTRAQLFASAMLGLVKKSELIERINKKRHQDSVRALGLLPLASGKQTEKDLLDRYQVLQEFLRSSRQFGSMRQESEKRAARIGQENLARNAGYSDPLRLQWAMEARAVADLADGPISLKVDGVELTLNVDALGEVSLTATKDEKPLKEIPARIKKDKSVAELRKRSTELKRQGSRMRKSLEDLMIRGEKFSGAELRDFMNHPLLAPLLCNLVLIGGDGPGYPDKKGETIVSYDNSVLKVNKAEELRIAHPHDLLRSKKWHLWQKDCFAKERVQPFKQVFRELYVLTSQEIKETTVSHRYAGQQVNPKQAVALLGSRGWVSHPEEGVRKTFHAEGLTVNLDFTGGAFTPLEMEGLTIDGVSFTKRSEWKSLPLEDVPPRIFSEVMRDLDLVVSVAHQGGVDPEASASTTEMRAALLREALQVLKIKNVRFSPNHVTIDGHLAQYSVHLGSGGVHLLPGGALCLVAIHAQHRGRLFLPFADNDPKTAEVLSKVLLLARDTEIKDPQLLDQIRSRS